jgi:hypothetical protein
MIMRITTKPPSSPPPSGTLLLFDRTLTRDYKQDGHEWVKKTSSKKVREDHVKLRYEGNYRVAGTYVHSSKTPTMHRRCYHLINEGGMSVRKLQESGKQSLVLVHYLDTAEASSSRALEAIGHQLRDSQGQAYDEESGSDGQAMKRPRSCHTMVTSSTPAEAPSSIFNVDGYPKTISAPPSNGVSETSFWTVDGHVSLTPSNLLTNQLATQGQANFLSHAASNTRQSGSDKRDLPRLLDVTPSKGYLGDSVQVVFSLSSAFQDFTSQHCVAQEYAAFSSVYLESQNYVRVAACCLAPVRKITPFSFKCDNLPSNLTSPGSWRVILVRIVLSSNPNHFRSNYSLEPHAAALIEKLLNIGAGMEDRFRQEGDSYTRLRFQDQSSEGWVEAVSMFGPKDFLLVNPLHGAAQNVGQLPALSAGALYHPL